jgi:dienelactone hydrolase
MIDIREQGIVAKLFLPNTGEPRPAVIVLSGSCGGFCEPVAQVLASKGYVTLALAYFNVDGLPKNLENIPLEYFFKKTGVKSGSGRLSLLNAAWCVIKMILQSAV